MKSYQVVIRPDAKQFSEVAEGHRSVCFKAEVWEMVGWSEVAAFTKAQKKDTQHEETVIKSIFFLKETLNTSSFSLRLCIDKFCKHWSKLLLHMNMDIT